MTRQAQAIILDFDGVVLESLAVKSAAFRELFARHSDHLDRIVAHHGDHPGVSRYDKFQFVYRTILRRHLTRAEMQRLDRRFNRLLRQGVLSCRFVPGARAFLRFATRRVPVYVASATPERELRAIVRGRGLAPYFTGVFGSPVTKADAIRRIVTEQKLDRRAVLFVGDAESDREAARAAGVRFIQRLTPGARPKRGISVHSLAELQRELKQGICGLRI